MIHHITGEHTEFFGIYPKVMAYQRMKNTVSTDIYGNKIKCIDDYTSKPSNII